LVHSYPCGKITLHHVDLFRLQRTSEVADLALAELAEFAGIVLVEWGDVVAASLGDHLVVRLDFVNGDEGARLIDVVPSGSSWASRWDRLSSALGEWRC
jgi:tRNA threonylcarbamoyladenosine biosynthesis protein TsaE